MTFAVVAVTPRSWIDHFRDQVALRQLEDRGVSSECPLCVTAYLRLQRIQHEKEERELRRPSRDCVQYD